MLGSACVDVGEVVIAKDSFNAGDFGFGLLFGAGGLGLAVGSIARRRTRAASRRSARCTRLRSRSVASATALAALAPNVWVALPLVALAGFGNGGASLYNVLLVQRGVPDRYLGRAFTVAMSITYAVLGPAMAVAGPLTRRSAAAGSGHRRRRLPRAGFVAFLLAPRLREDGAVTEAEIERSIRSSPRDAPPSRRRAARSRLRRGRAPGVDARIARRRRPRRRQAGARARDHARRERRPARVRRRPRPLPGHRPRLRRRRHRPAGRRQVVADQRARPARSRGRAERRRHLGRPVEPVHAGRAARRPDPAQRPLPRSRRLHPLDGHARPPRRPRGGDAPGDARARRVRARTCSSSRPSAPGRARSR